MLVTNNSEIWRRKYWLVQNKWFYSWILHFISSWIHKQVEKSKTYKVVQKNMEKIIITNIYKIHRKFTLLQFYFNNSDEKTGVSVSYFLIFFRTPLFVVINKIFSHVNCRKTRNMELWRHFSETQTLRIYILIFRGKMWETLSVYVW